MHALAAMVERLRTTSAKVGYVSALGMTATKHAVSILSTEPARIAAASGADSPHLDIPDKVKLGPRLVDEPPPGPATVETYTVEFGRDNQAVRTMLVLRLPDGRRTVANGELSDVPRLTKEEGVGKRGAIAPGTGGGPNQFVLGRARA
jgi:acetyl-CoA C-acetyltransferase